MSKLMQRSNKFRKKGFALVETIIALLILAIALLAMAFVPIMSTKLALQTVQREQALSLADNRLDLLEAVASQDIAGSENTGIYFISFDKSSAERKATVTVTWNGVPKPSSINLERDLSRISSLTSRKQ